MQDIASHLPPKTERSACMFTMLRQAGLKPTKQRVALAHLLFSEGDRHISAEDLHHMVQSAGVTVSLATVYNTLHQFTKSGLLREVAVDGARTYFDTNTHDHHHFYVEDDGSMMDIEGIDLSSSAIPNVPDDMEIVRVDVVVRLKRKER